MKKVEVYHHTKSLNLLRNILHEGLKAKKSPIVGAKVIYAYFEPIDDFPWVSFLVNPKDVKVGNNAFATLYLTSGNKKFRELYLASIMTLEKYMKGNKLDCKFRNLDGNYLSYYDPEVLVERDIIPPTELVKRNPEIRL